MCVWGVHYRVAHDVICFGFSEVYVCRSVVGVRFSVQCLSPVFPMICSRVGVSLCRVVWCCSRLFVQVQLWYRAIEYEKRNSQHLEPKLLADRVRLVYRQALNCMRFLPDMWCVAVRIVLFVLSHVWTLSAYSSAQCVCSASFFFLSWLGSVPSTCACM